MVKVPEGKANELVLEHVARYRLTLRATLTRVFFEGDEGRTDAVTRSLREEGFLVSRPLGRLSYYQLTSAGARHMGVPAGRAESMTPAKMETALAVLWFCCMGETRRSRLDAVHLRRLIREKPDPSFRQGIYCLEHQNQSRRLMRVQIVTERSQNRYLLQRIRHDHSRVAEHRVLKDYAKVGSYAQVILAPSVGRRASVIAGLEGAGLYSKKHRREIMVETYPPPAQLATALGQNS